ncbi:LysR substrate-binding domain-containing protein [Aidingimonas halophila]|uniref:DNA-binding transcriptional regulator, LysR family n=1 Tax=Aidingimonas halophila TaxID=574349 RepID=A0A1H2SJE9_9GAMM|nr:LysR substrate-binding domain-containing protein [Aidingimonas halophila]GHC17563.1 LysR family transcriptional regulator [Aidingimonas halophila]SDW31648.1 DNA-binding transcriptional regulator, LysR family [Aidingimonas halophila]
MTTPASFAANNAPLPLLDTEVLRTFVTIAESGSFTRAARQVFRTPSALSMQIKRLEDTLGQTLFVRESRQVRLTPEGEVLLGYGRRLLKLNEEAVTQFLAPSLEGRVGFGTSDDVGTRILPNVLAQFARTHPAVQVDVVVGSSVNMLSRLDDGELDLVLVTAGNVGQPARGERVHSEPLVWVGRDGGLAAQRSPLPVALAHHGCAWRGMALDALDRAGIDYRIAYTCEHCAGQEAAMLADLAVAPFPQSLIKAPLRKLDRDTLPPLGDYQLELVKRGGGSQASEALLGYVFEAFRDMYG